MGTRPHGMRGSGVYVLQAQDLNVTFQIPAPYRNAQVQSIVQLRLAIGAPPLQLAAVTVVNRSPSAFQLDGFVVAPLHGPTVAFHPVRRYLQGWMASVNVVQNAHATNEGTRLLYDIPVSVAPGQTVTGFVASDQPLTDVGSVSYVVPGTGQVVPLILRAKLLNQQRAAAQRAAAYAALQQKIQTNRVLRHEAQLAAAAARLAAEQAMWRAAEAARIAAHQARRPAPARSTPPRPPAAPRPATTTPPTTTPPTTTPPTTTP